MALNPDDSQWVQKLSVNCPTYFGKSDVLHYKALEALNKARAKFAIKPERLHHCKEALEAYKRAAQNRKFALEEACRQLREVLYFSGVVDLCLHRAWLVQTQELRGPAQSLSPTEEFEFQKQEEVTRA